MVALQPPLFMEFSRQEYCNGLHFLLQGIFLTQGLNLLLLFDTWEAPTIYVTNPIKCILELNSHGVPAAQRAAPWALFPLGVALAEPEAFRA